MIISDMHWLMRLAGRHIKIRRVRHCAWCGEEFTTVTGLNDAPQIFCSSSHQRASSRARQKRKAVQEEIEKVTALKAERLEQKSVRYVYPSPIRDNLLTENFLPVLSMYRKFPANTRCHYCDKTAKTRDHIVPQASGGTNHYWNLVPACKKCNMEKADKITTCTCSFCDRAQKLHAILIKNLTV